jgi:hypothetical protein
MKDLGKIVYAIVYGAALLTWGLLTQVAILAAIAVPFLLLALVR